MRIVKLTDSMYKKAENISKNQGIEVNILISDALNHGLEVLNEQRVLELYREHKITLQRASELLSVDIWEMIEKVKKADIHIDYSEEELTEDLR
ncbi:MAG: UPF0175 family protein [Deltaproteobacteria bacterium]|nr:UPF0175 family protein [Deltaproteobacteria bacterium]